MMMAFGFVCWAQETPVAVEDAAGVAGNWLRLGQEEEWGWKPGALLDRTGVQQMVRGEKLLAYVFPVLNGGYIVVPAYREFPPVSAYSTGSDLNLGKPDGFGEMLGEVLQHKLGILQSFSSGTVPAAGSLRLHEEITKNRDLWEFYTASYEEFRFHVESFGHDTPQGDDRTRNSLDDIGPLLTSSWDQYWPYNNFCPEGDGGTCVVGCVATACAQIIAFWEYPSAGTGSHSYYWWGDYSCDGSTPSEMLSATYSDSYDWDNILDDYSGGETQAQRDAVAELCYEVGVSVDMDYGYCGSGAYTWDVMYALTTYFEYSSSIDQEDRDDYASAESWFSMLQTDLNYNRPLQYRISRHSIVCDGWRVAGTNQIHLNYGWDDGHNAWYTVDNLYCDWDGCDPMVEYVIRRIYPAMSLEVTAPNGGETWMVGDPATITWTSTEMTENIKIELMRDYPSGSWETITSGTSNDGSYTWPEVTGPLTNYARIRISGTDHPGVEDESDGSFVIDGRLITVSAPNGGETWYLTEQKDVAWSSHNVTGNVRIELNRDYPGGSWEILYDSTPDDGLESWNVSGDSGENCRIRVTSLSYPEAADASDADFIIAEPSLTVTHPNGGETLDGDGSEFINWNSTGITGEITVELNRNYPTGDWDLLVTVPNGGVWITLGGPPTTHARIRLTSLDYPAATDESDGDFEITIADSPPQISHDPHGDVEAGVVVFVARVTDDYSTPSCRLYYKQESAAEFDSTQMVETLTPDEYSAEIVLTEGTFLYCMRAEDDLEQSIITDTMELDVGDCSPTEIFDDGTAEGFNWAPHTGFSWAVKYEPEDYPYQLCGARVAVARVSPDSMHSPILVEVLDSDGFGGMPGTVLWSETSGSVGNEVGGLDPGVLHWATVLIRDGAGEPIILDAPFYVAVSNPVYEKYEAFGRDDNLPNAGNSYFYDGCELEWYSENDPVPNAFGGNRMIRILGSALEAPMDVVIFPDGVDIKLAWTGTGAPYYRVYSSSVSEGPFDTFVGSTADTSYTHTNVLNNFEVMFYEIRASSEP